MAELNPKGLYRITSRDEQRIVMSNELGGDAIFDRPPDDAPEHEQHQFDWDASDEDVLLAVQSQLHPDGTRWDGPDA